MLSRVAIRDGVRIGSMIPNAGPEATTPGIREMAAAAEAAGADGLWVSDHLLQLDARTDDYPYSADGVPTWSMTDDYFEALVSCMAMAEVTTTARVGTAILVLPQRNVLEVAKTAASVDRLSGGRLVLGVGAGWYRAEFEALGYGYESRGRRFDEMLDVLHDCWSGRPSAFSGQEITVPDHVVLEPRPAQPDGVPLLVGGVSKVARRRAAERGDGWIGIAFADRWDPEELRERHDDVLARRSQAGREGPFEMVLNLHSGPSELDAVPDLVATAAEIGFDEVIVESPWWDGLQAGADLVGAARAAVAVAER
jgi:probable F420-dependent oxidoreductase